MTAARLDAVLGVRALGRDDLAAAAQAAPAADRVEVDAERASRVEDRRACREATAPARRREDDLRAVRGHAPLPLPPPAVSRAIARRFTRGRALTGVGTGGRPGPVR